MVFGNLKFRREMIMNKNADGPAFSIASIIFKRNTLRIGKYKRVVAYTTTITNIKNVTCNVIFDTLSYSSYLTKSSQWLRYNGGQSEDGGQNGKRTKWRTKWHMKINILNKILIDDEVNDDKLFTIYNELLILFLHQPAQHFNILRINYKFIIPFDI